MSGFAFEMPNNFDFIARIEKAREQELTKLDLSFPDNCPENQKLKYIPEAVFDLTWLEELNLTGNSITSIPESIAKLSNLKKLFLNRNEIEILSEKIGELGNLVILSLKKNKIKKIPKEIGKLAKLTHLFLAKNTLVTIPESIGELTQLTILFLQDNILAIIPNSIKKLTNLVKLNLSKNAIKFIPKSIGNLTNLTDLDLSDNIIENIPDSIGNLTNLTDLDLSKNEIRIIPNSINKLPILTNLKLDKIPWELPSIQTVINYNLKEKYSTNRLIKYLFLNLKLELKNTIISQFNNINNQAGKMTRLKNIRIFLASSSELKSDRQEFQIFIGYKNNIYTKQNIFLELVLWEDFIDAMSATRLQDEYNKAVESSDIFVSLFHTKVGKYTKEEFTKAWGKFQDQGKPQIYTYFNQKPFVANQDVISLIEFQQELDKLGHFYTKYNNIEHLKYKFSEQLTKIMPQLLDISQNDIE